MQLVRGIDLLVTADSHPAQVIVSTNFLIIDFPSIYTVIGLPTLNTLRVVASMNHLALKFPNLVGVGVV